MEYKKLSLEEFKEYIKNTSVKRSIKRIQLHHTYSPSYKHFDGNNHLTLQQNMSNYHINSNGWNDIGQHFTIFPDGFIVTGRGLEKEPAGIRGANSGAVCVECLGNFDECGDVMRDEQKNAIAVAVKTLLDKWGLRAENAVTYHAWWASDGREIGDYVKGHSVKTCPGTAFFGGNTLTAYEKNLMPLIENSLDKELCEVININDIVWELSNAGLVSDSKLWLEKCDKDINVYWLCRKVANRIRGIA